MNPQNAFTIHDHDRHVHVLPLVHAHVLRTQNLDDTTVSAGCQRRLLLKALINYDPISFHSLAIILGG